jgi:hypothetical protein
LQDLTNVSSTAPSSGDNGKALVWNQATGRWQAEQVAYSNLSGAPTLGTVAAQNYQFSTYSPVVASTSPGDYSAWTTQGFSLSIQSGTFAVIGRVCICYFWVGLASKPLNLNTDRWIGVSVPFAGTNSITPNAQWTPTLTAYGSTFTNGLTEINSSGPWAILFIATNPIKVLQLADLTGTDRMLAMITYFIDV